MVKNCLFCSFIFEDTSRAKNKKYCSAQHGNKHWWILNSEKTLKERKTKLESEETKATRRERKRDYNRERYQNDTLFKLTCKIRVRISRALKTNKKDKSLDLIGCRISELKSYIESKWQPEMTWSNYANDGWHIDHIKPLDAFNLEDVEQQKLACHYTNLQPLWSEDNFKKSNKS